MKTMAIAVIGFLIRKKISQLDILYGSALILFLISLKEF
jgi:hypothetical protein